MSFNLQLTATAAGDTFTIVPSGDVVNVYHNQSSTGTPESSVAASDLASITLNGVGADSVTVDTAAGTPLLAAVNVTSGAVTFNNDLGTGVALTVNTGAAVNFSSAQNLIGLDVQAGASVNMTGASPAVLTTGTLALGGAVNLATDTLVVTSPNASDTAAIGATADANSGVTSTNAVVTTTTLGTVTLVGSGGFTLNDGASVAIGTLLALPISNEVVDLAAGGPSITVSDATDAQPIAGTATSSVTVTTSAATPPNVTINAIWTNKSGRPGDPKPASNITPGTPSLNTGTTNTYTVTLAVGLQAGDYFVQYNVNGVLKTTKLHVK